MAVLRKYLVILAVVSVVTGCYSNFEPDIKSTPVLCMNSLLVPGEPLTVSLTRTWRWSEGSPDYDLDIIVRDAEITYTVNGSEIGTLTFDNKKYRADYIPEPGDHVVLSARSDRYDAPTAVKILERCGLNVQLKGSGRVVSQSIPKGSDVTPGAKITLGLRI